MRLPFIQFFPSDWIADTRTLSLAAKGAWIDIICMLHNSQIRGTVTLPIVGWARVIGASADQAKAVIDELCAMRVCDAVTECNKDVTLSCRRIQREEKKREQTRQRVENYRDKQRNKDECDVCNKVCNAKCNASETDRYQIPDTRNKEGNQSAVQNAVRKAVSGTVAFSVSWEVWLSEGLRLGLRRHFLAGEYNRLKERGWTNSKGEQIGDWKKYISKIAANGRKN